MLILARSVVHHGLHSALRNPRYGSTVKTETMPQYDNAKATHENTIGAVDEG